MREWRLAGVALVVLCMVVSMVPLGCGATDAYAVAPRGNGLALPPMTVQALQACVKEGGRLRQNAYEVEFAVELTGERVTKVLPKGSRLDDGGLERCMIDALRRMADAGYSPDPDELVSRGGLLPARGLLANASVLPQVIRLIPVVVGSGGTMIVVAVAVLVVVAVVSLKDATDENNDEDKRCREVKEKCIGSCSGLPGMPAPGGGRFRRCMRECMEAEGCSF